MRAREDGASAVEFALISMIFFPLLFGIIQYGLYFNDSLNVRQGVREAARMGVVRNYPTCGTAATDAARVVCQTKSQIGALTGPSYARVLAPDGWVRGKRLIVCAMVASDGGIGLLPMPRGGIIRSKIQMSIEDATATPSGTFPLGDAAPAGQSWTWCA